MLQRPLGRTGISVGAIGLGAMPLSIQDRPSEEQAISVIHRALDLGVTLIDTADSYCLDENDKHHNERLIAKALSLYEGDTSSVIVATKGGLMRPQGDWTVNGNPKHIQKTIRESYQALGGTKPIPLWQLHAVDDHFPLEETLQPVRDAVHEGLIRFVGLSNVTVKQIEKAQTLVDIISVQNRYNPWDRSPEKDGVLKYCEQTGKSFLPWSPLGGGSSVSKIPQIPILGELAQQKRVSPYQIVLAWMLTKSPVILPIPGASRLSSVEDSIKALNVKLTADEMKTLDSCL